MKMIKYIQDLYAKDYKILMKVIKEYLSNGETYYVSIYLEASV